MLSIHKSFHSIQILFTILLFVLQFCFVVSPNPHLWDLNVLPSNEIDEASHFDPTQATSSSFSPSFQGGHSFNAQYHVTQVLNIRPKVLGERDIERWLNINLRPDGQTLKGDNALTDYAIAKVKERYPKGNYQLKQLYGVYTKQMKQSILGGKTLYWLTNAEIPIYFALGAKDEPSPTAFHKLRLSFWLIEDDAKKFNFLKKHYLGQAELPVGTEIQQKFMDQLPAPGDGESFLIPRITTSTTHDKGQSHSK